MVSCCFSQMLKGIWSTGMFYKSAGFRRLSKMQTDEVITKSELLIMCLIV